MAITVQGITHIYNKGLPTETVAIKDVSFAINDGEYVGIIGHTGSGKSTLLQHLNGLLKVDEGTITVDDTVITEPRTSMVEIRKRVGLVFQYPEYQLFEETVAKDVAFGPNHLDLTEEEVQERVEEALGLVGLDYEEVKDKSPFDFSGGQKRRIAIAGVVAMRPKVLILDEPVAGLDPGTHKDILEMIDRIHERDPENIIILVSHNMNDVAMHADKVLVMDHGELVMQGTPGEVFTKEDELKAIGLDIPDLTNLALKLQAAGINVPRDTFTIEEMAEQIAADLPDSVFTRRNAAVHGDEEGGGD